MNNTIVLTLMLALFALGSCNSKPKQQTQPSASKPATLVQPGGILRLPLEIDPSDSVVTAMDLSDPRLWALARATELPLVRSTADGQIAPGLAARWNTSDGRTWTFQLQQFGEAGTLPGEALLHHWQQILRGEDGPLRAQLSDLLMGAREYAQGNADTISGFKLQDGTLTLELTRPNHAFGLWLSQPGLGINDAAVPNASADGTSIPVGAFLPVTGLDPSGDTFTLSANPGFPYGAPKLDQLQFVLLPDRAEQLERFEAGTLHAANLSIDDTNKVKENPQLAPLLVRHETASPLVALFDHQQFPWGDDEFQNKLGLRQALNWSMDRALLTDLTSGLIMAWPHYFPKAMSDYVDPGLLDTPTYSLTPEIEKARAGLEEADHGQGSLLPQGMVLAYPENDFDKFLGQEIQSIWEEISVKLRPYPADMAEMRGLLELGTHEVTLRHLRPAYPDPDALAYPHMHSSLAGLGGNWSMLNDPALDELLQQGQALTDKVARQRNYQQLSKLLEERALFVFIGVDVPSLLISDELAGYALTPYDFDASLAAQDFTQLGLTGGGEDSGPATAQE